MTSLLPRSTWTSTPRPVSKLVRLDPSRVMGFAVHYPGNPGSNGTNPSLTYSCQLLEGERAFHVNGRGWTDIAYGGAIDQAGRVFDCRGAEWRSAANGDQDLNSSWGAVTVLIGNNEAPTSAAIDAVRWWRENVWLPLYPHATRVVGHRDLYQTDCPGNAMYQIVHSGSIVEVDDMPTVQEIAAGLAADDHFINTIVSRMWTASWPAPIQGHPDRTESAQDRLMWAARGTAVGPILDSILAAVHGVADVEAFAARVAAHIPPSVGGDPGAVARAILAEIQSMIHTS